MKRKSHVPALVISCTAISLVLCLVVAIAVFASRQNAVDEVSARIDARGDVQRVRKAFAPRRYAVRGVRPSRPQERGGGNEDTPRPKPVFDEGRLLEFAAAYREMDAEGRMSLEKVAGLCERFFGGTAFSLRDVADKLCAMFESDDPSVRISALTALSAFRRTFDDEDSADDVSDDDGDDVADDDDVADGPIEVPDDIEQRVTLTLMGAGLTDSDAGVRDAAYSVLLSLPSEERDMLSIQLLGNNDDVLKAALLKTTMKADDDAALALNFHALDDDNPEIRSIANGNILSKTGRSFQSSEEAFEWLESRHDAVDEPPSGR